MAHAPPTGYWPAQLIVAHIQITQRKQLCNLLGDSPSYPVMAYVERSQAMRELHRGQVKFKLIPRQINMFRSPQCPKQEGGIPGEPIPCQIDCVELDILQ